MTVKKIIIKYLNDNGFDGLYHENDCGCRKEALFTCDGSCEECSPGHLLPGDKNAEWYIGKEKPSQNIGYDQLIPCPKCGSNNIKCRGSIFNCEDCGERW